MHIHNVSKKWSRLDQVFISDHSTGLVNICDTITSQRGINTDHLPILTKLELATPIAEDSAMHNFREVDWGLFNKSLEKRLERVGCAERIHTLVWLNEMCSELTKVIQDMITEMVPITHICTRTKRWWTKELMQLWKKANKLGRQASQLSSLPYHRMHAEHADAVKTYQGTLEATKQRHWRDWLEKAEDLDI